MKITRVEQFPAVELIEKLKGLRMLYAPEIRPYTDVFISLEHISTDILHPAQYYILQSELEKVRNLRWALSARNIDIFNLNGYVKIWLEGIDEPIDLLPPVVEESIEKNGKVVCLINDGMHRVFLSRLEWVIPQVVYIRGIPKNLPYYAYPIPEGWDKVDIVENLPEGTLKKWHRIKDYKTLYRNFNSVFENVGGPRGNFSKGG
ncbi:hypothetical protein [Candidatus Magnetominusculus xianensis]|uniref:ParB-like catalytic effector domain-containing protein n=1 Tax=Candidatus Magnetominusculus xianensis TaxID=1748249 RepID=A0ABR5SDR1_9BACT|nr:hypothetical protein [Candidatus Magnetominusculus xianensis]KWT79143.1 hypothetical protein ASN18_2764 [Candidatus Magnetominusculus xianensis]MBF0405580.1 hypothetical protein [Nitrospirota bacterium]